MELIIDLKIKKIYKFVFGKIIVWLYGRVN